jgi:hypothetical protein
MFVNPNFLNMRVIFVKFVNYTSWIYLSTLAPNKYKVDFAKSLKNIKPMNRGSISGKGMRFSVLHTLHSSVLPSPYQQTPGSHYAGGVTDHELHSVIYLPGLVPNHKQKQPYSLLFRVLYYTKFNLFL